MPQRPPFPVRHPTKPEPRKGTSLISKMASMPQIRFIRGKRTWRSSGYEVTGRRQYGFLFSVQESPLIRPAVFRRQRGTVYLSVGIREEEPVVASCRLSMASSTLPPDEPQISGARLVSALALTGILRLARRCAAGTSLRSCAGRTQGTRRVEAGNNRQRVCQGSPARTTMG